MNGINLEVAVQNGVRVLVLILLIAALLFVLSFTGIVKCNQVPVIGGGWCNAYWYIKTLAFGQPRVLIVYGESGLGNPLAGEGSLRNLLSDPEILGVHADTLPVERANLGNLRGYDLVIVDHAREIETKTLRAFIDYATGPTGGTLVCTGDAGTELGPNDSYLYREEREGTITGEEAEKIGTGEEGGGISEAEEERRKREAEEEKKELGWKKIGPWARRDGEYMVSFDQLLGVHYLGQNFCEAVECKGSSPIHAGTLVTEPSGSHPLIRGMSQTLPLYVIPGEDFALVETLGGGITSEVLSLEFSGQSSRYDFNKSVPLIVTAGIGERVLYYSMPPEHYANPKLEDAGKGRYLLPIENLYYGTLKG